MPQLETQPRPFAEILEQHEQLLIITPHPDDTAIMLGGAAILGVRQYGPENTHAIVATDGEEGVNRLPRMPNNANFVKRGGRRFEEAASLQVLGIPYENTAFLGLPDGAIVKDEHKKALTGRVTEQLEEDDTSTLVLTLGPESDGHPDHAAAHFAAITAVRALKKQVSIASLNAQHKGRYYVSGTPIQQKMSAAVLHASQYTIGEWLKPNGKGGVTLGPAFNEASAFYPPLAHQETYDPCL